MYLLRSRLSFSVRPSSCSPHRLNQLKFKTQPARYTSNDASDVNRSALNGIQHVDNYYPSNNSVSSDQPLNLELPNHSSLGSAYQNSPALGQGNEPALQPNFSEQTPVGPLDRDRALLLFRDVARKIIQREGLDENLVEVSERIFCQLEDRLRYRRVPPDLIYSETRIRLLSLYTTHDYANQWNDACDEIFRAKIDGRKIVSRRIPTLTEDGLRLLHKIRTDCLGSFCETWKGLDRDTKAVHWQSLAFWLLQNSPELTLEFLLVTTNDVFRPNFDMISDIFAYLDQFCFDKVRDWKKDSHTYLSVLQTCMSPEHWPIITVPHNGIRVFLNRSDYQTIASTYKLVQKRRIFMQPATTLCFMRLFIEHGDVEGAISALKWTIYFQRPGFTLNSLGVINHCCKLLTLDSVTDSDGGRNFLILPRLLKLGVRPNRAMMNIVLKNAFKTRDSQLGYDILQFMRKEGHGLDEYTYMALLMDAVDRENRGDVESLVAEVKKQDSLRNNPYIMSKIFHAHYVFTAKHMDVSADPADVFYSVLDMYNQLYDIRPLKDLTIIPPNYLPPPGGTEAQPSMMALYIMIATYFRCQKRITVAERVYSRFRSLVAKGHEVISRLAETDHTYNEFLVALRKSPEGLRPCVRIVEDMLQSGSSKVDVGEQKGQTISHVKPTTRTWTILLSAFNFHRQPQAAEKVREMMRMHKVEYNDVTWNTIINGYVNNQKIPEAAQAIKTMEEQGFTVDSYTLRSLRYLKDPERLWVAIEELDRAERGDEGLDSSSNSGCQPHVDGEENDLLGKRLENLKTRMKPKS
ncbi:pentatricopeptide repeat protein [Aspergillus sclerotialis]|uniref:Pentatricopeptide repeat protein n=1 Tax=Aspergillus sclerotialis TaxID=2070753 RepID=A0A3A2ZNM9_9EURO|nr:pentatricopeptide repeat protein [Aspergillus sclerotialis]